jgi:2-amino-4-hydroxy-6-hydroxymethyldihydropteridine diphosphokinase
MPTVFIGIGSNLGDRERLIADALSLVGAHEGIELAAISKVRETEPVGVVDQPRFLNAAAKLETELPAREVLERLLAVERELGRVRVERYGPRTIDLDLLLYGDEVIDEPGLRVPHPRLQERRFVLEPLLDLDPGLAAPGLGQIRALLTKLE